MRVPRLAAGIVLVLTVVSLACGPAGSLSASAPAATPPLKNLQTPAPTSTISPADVVPEINLPADYLEGVQARVDAGEWAYEAGLLAVLRTFAGRSADPFAAGDLADREGTGVVLDAQRYVRQAADSPERAEMEELLGIILPTSDRLLPFARPEGQVSSRPPGLAAPSADPLCADLYLEGFPEKSEVVCYVFAQEPLGDYMIEVFWPSEWSSGSTEYEYAKAALQAAKDSWQVFRDLGLKGGGVQLVFTLLPNKDEKTGPNILASVPSKGGAVGCIMPVYPLALQAYASETTSGLSEFKQVIAHEMFHCFQGWNYPDHFDEWSVQRWWGEGSADYFSNLVYPDANWEWGRRFSFVERSTEEQMFYLSYENTFFFQFLEKKIQPQGILDLFHLLPTGKPLIEHQKVLSGYAGMSDYWHEFAQSVVDDSLIDTGGAAIPFPDHLSDTVAVLGTDTYDLPARDFVLTRYRINLGSGLGYHLAVDQTDVEVLHAARPEAGTGWSPIAIDRETGCASYLAIVTSTGEQTAPRTFRLAATVDQPAGAGSVCDACVVGRWRMTHSSYMAMYDAILSEAGDAAPFSTGASGDLFLDVRNDGTLDAEAASFGVKAISGMPDSQGDPLYTETLMSLDGMTGMSYLAMNGEFVMQVTHPGITTKLTVSIMGQEIDVPVGKALGAAFGGGEAGEYYPYNYMCKPKQKLTLSPIVHPELYKGNVWDFVWVGP
jgi:hypothetical protein